jgi:type IV secretory pathway TrbD component
MTRAAMTGRVSDFRAGMTRVAIVGAISLGLLYAGRALVDPNRAHLVMAGGIIAVLVGIGLRSPRSLLYGLVVWLAALGLVRRLASEFSPAPQSDPLLLVEAAAVGVLLVGAAARGAFSNLTGLAKAVLALSLLVVLGAVNPLGGSLTAGLGSLYLILIPMLAFWVGRSICDDRTLATTLGLVAMLAVAAGGYGLAQTFSGFPSWDAAWISSGGYEALNVGGATRAFGPFSSASEYAIFLGIGFVAWLAFGFRLVRLPLALGAVALLATAIFYESSRGIIFTLVVAVALMVAARRRLPIAVSAALAVAALFAVPFVTRSVTSSPTVSAGNTGSALAAHQIQGLSSPLSSQNSTLGAHFSLFTNGLRSAIANPVGLGIGSVTIAGSKYGAKTVSTEVDPSNAAVALGIPGLIAYLAVVGIAFFKAYSLASARRDALSIAALGLLVITLLQWLNGGQYAVAFLVWLVLGWVDRARPAQHA